MTRESGADAASNPPTNRSSRLLTDPLGVINIGLSGFGDDLAARGIEAVHVDWAPPASGDPVLARILNRLDGAPSPVSAGKSAIANRIAAANAKALERMLQGDPWLVDVIPAAAVLPRLADRHILHAGPPIDWERMCGPMRGAVTGIAVYEGWAADLAEAERMAEAGAFRLEPEPPSRLRRPHDRHDDTVANAAGGGEPGLRQPGLLRHQRRPGQGHALWRQRRRGSRPHSLADERSRSAARSSAPRHSAASP